MFKRCLIGLLSLLCILLSAPSCAPNASRGLEIRFLDVGQADAILIRTSVGDVLIDAGSNDSQVALCNRLAQLGVERLALAVFTHPDEDHVGGADGVLRRFPTSTVWISPFFGNDGAAKDLLDAASDTGAIVEKVYNGFHVMLGKVGIAVLSPYGGMNGADDNDKSIVLKVACGSTSALFMGDAGAFAEELLLDLHGRTQVSCDLLKVAHHGANASTGARFLQAVSPDYAVISCGAGNFYGHPHGELLARLEAVGAEILRTDLCGEVVFYSDGVSLYYE